jgi:hypothetical protein
MTSAPFTAGTYLELKASTIMGWINEYPYWLLIAAVWPALFVLRRWGDGISYRVNSRLRKADFRLNRTRGGALQGWLQMPGYSPLILVWTLYIVMVLFVGPTRSPPLSLLAAVVGGVAIVLALGAARYGWLHEVTILLVFTIVASVYFFTPGRCEADGSLYRHVFLFVIASAALVTCVARWLARWLFVDFKNEYQELWSTAPELLRRVELHVVRPKVTFTFWRLVRSGIASPTRDVLMFLLPVAIIILLVPHEYMSITLVTGTLLSWCIVTLAGIHERLNNVLQWVKSAFARGIIFLVSSVVIVLAACRWFDYSYVSILLDSTTASTILWFLAAVYATLWFYDYWIGRFLVERLLALLDPDPTSYSRTEIEYSIEPAAIAAEDLTEIKATERIVQIHGTRFVVVGKYKDKKTGGLQDGWELYDRVRLFTTLVQRVHGVSPIEQAKFGIPDLRQRLYLYFGLLDAVLVVAMLVAGAVCRLSDTVPELMASNQASGEFSLQQRLFDNGGQAARKRAILLSASGGGTRAALYATSLFQGLSELHALNDVVLLSGVSGGSASIADLLLHRKKLVAQHCPDSWTIRAQTMSQPFIDDVLRGTLETRLASGTRMGTLLAESLERHLVVGKSDENRTGAFSDVGVIFNATLAGTGHWDSEVTRLLPADPRSAGGRLVVTNLKGEGIFPQRGFHYAESEYLNYVVTRDPTSKLTDGAALSANFPPVFSNAAVDTFGDAEHKDQADRHWVTDGGASDNRGAISMLYALRHALIEESKGIKRRPPTIHVIVADASAVSLDFSQDRGLSSTVGAAEKYANQLMVGLLNEIEELYKSLGGDANGMRLYFLPMPLVLRARGGVHTHWMLPSYVRLANLEEPQEAVVLAGEQARELIMGLHRADAAPPRSAPTTQSEAAFQKALEWINAEDALEREVSHRSVWNRLVSDLRSN